jgi:hypothetical protein
VTLNADARQASNDYDRMLKDDARAYTEKSVNTARARLVIRTAAAVLIGVSVAAAPGLTYAQHAGGGGGGGGHMSAGGAHFGGGAHMAAPHFSGVHGMSGYHGTGYGGVHYAGYGHGYAAGHVGTAYHAGGSAYYHGGYGGYHGGYYGPHFHGVYWGGGYWHGGYWPHVWYGPGWAWFYPVLPIGYATFWWGGMPYYYWNNLYYTWNPGYNGYVVTDPPPAAGNYDDSSGSADPSGVTAAPAGAPDAGAGGGGGAGADVFVYPRNGQSEQQANTDRYECHSWAVTQTGFDPTRSAQPGTGGVADYRRAMIACLDARGYSAR